MAKWFGILTLVVGGLIVADALTHPTGVNAASQGVSSIETPAISGLLGVNPSKSK